MLREWFELELRFISLLIVWHREPYCKKNVVIPCPQTSISFSIFDWKKISLVSAATAQLTFPLEFWMQGAYLDYVGAPLAAANSYGKENPMAAGYQVQMHLIIGRYWINGCFWFP